MMRKGCEEKRRVACAEMREQRGGENGRRNNIIPLKPFGYSSSLWCDLLVYFYKKQTVSAFYKNAF